MFKKKSGKPFQEFSRFFTSASTGLGLLFASYLSMDQDRETPDANPECIPLFSCLKQNAFFFRCSTHKAFFFFSHFSTPPFFSFNCFVWQYYLELPKPPVHLRCASMRFERWSHKPVPDRKNIPPHNTS
jgi:hypothetical protein